MADRPGICRRIPLTLGEELGQDHYDAALARVGLNLWESPWLPVYAIAADYLATAEGPVVDVGCGTGRLAKLMYERGEVDYLGIDFSPRRIREAQGYVPAMRFEVGDAYDDGVRSRFGAFRRFAFLEFLEHIGDDLGVLRAVPSGAFVVLSVPSYDSAGHVRQFNSATAVVTRYGELLDLDPEHSAVLPRPRRPHKRIFVLGGYRL